MGAALVSGGGKVKSTLPAVFAHPDDISFGIDRTLAKGAANGTRVLLVCASRGKVGEISDASLATPESLAHVREVELRCAVNRYTTRAWRLASSSPDFPEAGSPWQPMRAFLALWDGERLFPEIVVIHENFGLNDNIREITHRFAREGYTAQVVDLFSTGNRMVSMLRIVRGRRKRPLNTGIVADLQCRDFPRHQGLPGSPAFFLQPHRAGLSP
jgi:LmbE family N-acetylglucosaminyl deacetylase